MRTLAFISYTLFLPFLLLGAVGMIVFVWLNSFFHTPMKPDDYPAEYYEYD